LKPLHLNLASRPYRDYKPLYAVVVVTSIAIALLMLNNVDTYYRYVTETQTTRATIAKLERQAADEHNRAMAADNQLRGFDLVALDNETRFINARLAERAFSWSELLDRLEDVIPQGVRIRNISPSFSKTATVHLEMACESKSASGMLDSLTALQRDPQFMNPFPHNETANDAAAGTGGTTPAAPGAALYTFSIGVDFKPTIARSER
jgi:Tfp pilus assembly protein PilN